MNVPARVIETQMLRAAVKGSVVLPGDATYDGRGRENRSKNECQAAPAGTSTWGS